VNIILLGAPGAGKGTQAEYICTQFHIPKISTGDMLRQAVANATPLGIMAKEVMARGELVADEIILGLIQGRIKNPDCDKGFLFDGFPRTLVQAEALMKKGIDIDYVINIAVPDANIIERLSGRRMHAASGRTYHLIYNPPKIADTDDVTGEPLVQREDDKIDVIKHRLSVYHAETAPLIAWYQSLSSSQQGKSLQYIHIDGIGEVGKIQQAIKISLSRS